MHDGPLLIAKLEADAVPASAVACLCIYEPATETMHAFGHEEPIAAGFPLLRQAGRIVTHSKYHLDTLERLYGLEIDRHRVVDTLAVCQAKIGRAGNALSAWAARFGERRVTFRGSAVWTQEAEDHCITDIKYIWWLYQTLCDQGLLT